LTRVRGYACPKQIRSAAIPNRNKLPESARHVSLSYLRYLYRIGDVRGLKITGSDGGAIIDVHPPRSPEEAARWKWQRQKD